jgi:hypothetical protein
MWFWRRIGVYLLSRERRAAHMQVGEEGSITLVVKELGSSRTLSLSFSVSL